MKKRTKKRKGRSEPLSMRPRKGKYRPVLASYSCARTTKGNRLKILRQWAKKRGEEKSAAGARKEGEKKGERQIGIVK